MRRAALLVATAFLVSVPSVEEVRASGQGCSGSGVELLVLGSGGPEIQDRRNSTGYLVLEDGRARLLVDAGSGTANRFGDADARVEDLDLIVLTHLHVDHAADLPVLLKSATFSDRTRELPVIGPEGNRLYPGTKEFVRLLFDGRKGVYRYLGDHLTGAGGYFVLKPRDVDLREGRPEEIWSDGGLRVVALSSGHGPVPSIALRVELRGVVLAFSGDTGGEARGLAELARGADLFVAHNAVPEGAEGLARDLHMPPSVIGALSADAGVRRLVLSHRMLRTLGREEETLRFVRQRYAGPAEFADDGSCYPVAPPP